MSQSHAADTVPQNAPRRARAVVCRGVNDVGIEEIEVEAPQHGEVMVKMFACGICHSDLNIIDGSIPAPMPVVIGHEGAGTVVAVGPGVEHLSVGDHVVNSFVSVCGKCRYCSGGRPSLCDQAAKSAYTLPSGALRTRDAGGAPLHVLCGLGAMAEYATMHVDNVVKVDADVPLDRAALRSLGAVPSRLFGKIAPNDWSTAFDGVLVIRDEGAPTFEPRR